MHITIPRSDLLTALRRVGAAADPADMVAMRQSVLIVAEELTGKITFGATDGVLTVIYHAPGRAEKPGRAVLNHRRFSAIVNELPEGAVEVSVDKFKVVVKATGSKRKFTMTSHDPVDFPDILSERPAEILYAVEAKILQQAASEVAFGIEKSRLDGVLLSPDGKRFHLVSLSGKALVVATGWFTTNSCPHSLVLPRTLLDAIATLTADTTELVLSEYEQKVFVSAPGTLISCAKLAGNFPNVWNQVLSGAPKDKRFKVSSEKFLESVKAVSVAADMVEGSERFIQIDVRYQGSECVVSTKRSEKNQGEDELEVLEPSDGEFVLHIDGQLLTQALRAFGPAEVDLYYDAVNGQDALFLKNENLQVMLMPILVTGPAKASK